MAGGHQRDYVLHAGRLRSVPQSQRHIHTDLDRRVSLAIRPAVSNVRRRQREPRNNAHPIRVATGGFLYDMGIALGRRWKRNNGG
jgi:hypothetical protein